MAALRHVDDIFTVQRIVGGHAIDNLPDAHAVVVVGELRVGSVLHHAGQHTSGFPRERPAVVGQRVADGVVGNRLTADGRNLVLPVAVPIGIKYRFINPFKRRCQRIRCTQVTRHVAAAIIQVHRGFSCMGIVDASELTETVILIRRRQAVVRHRSDIAHIVVCIREILPILRDALHQRRGLDAVSILRRKILIRRQIRGLHAIRSARRNTTNRIIGICDNAVVRAIAKLRGAILHIVDVGRFKAGAVVHRFFVGIDIAVCVVAHRVHILRRADRGRTGAFQNMRASRSLARVVFRPDRAIEFIVPHISDLTVCAIVVGKARSCRIVVMDTRYAAEVVARVMHLAAIAVFHAHQRAITRVRMPICLFLSSW